MVADEITFAYLPKEEDYGTVALFIDLYWMDFTAEDTNADVAVFALMY